MSREDYLARTIDRKREASSTKAARSARQMFVRMLARQRLTALLAEVEPDERATLIYDVLDVAGEQLHPLVGRVEAATRFNCRSRRHLRLSAPAEGHRPRVCRSGVRQAD